MKNAKNQQVNDQVKMNKPKPEVRDDLDSRKKKEAGYKKDNDDTNKEDKKKYDQQ